MINGSTLLEGYTPEVDATVVTRILDAGMIVFLHIRITCPCVLYPLTPHFLQGFTLFSYFCSKTYIVGTR